MPGRLTRLHFGAHGRVLEILHPGFAKETVWQSERIRANSGRFHVVLRNSLAMSIQEILDELPKLTREEHEKILERIIQLDCEKDCDKKSELS
jgi:hypothetical protein